MAFASIDPTTGRTLRTFSAHSAQEVEARPEGDIWFYRGPVDCVTLTPGKFAVLFPQDAHAPSMAVEAPEKVRKCVFKVKL